MRERLKALFQNAALTLLSGVVTLLALEVLLRCLPVATAPPVRPPTVADPIQRYVAHRPFTWSLGWNFYKIVHGRTNAQGFVADDDYDQNATTPLAAVLGDSFIEAMQVPYAASVTGLLQAMLADRGRAYAFAQSGAALSQYVAYARHACRVYHPERLVVSVVGNDFDESLHAHRQRDGLFNLHARPDGSFDWRLTPLPPSRLVELIARESALALYLARNVGIGHLVALFRMAEAKAAPSPWVGNTSAGADPKRIKEGFEVIAWFLRALPEQGCLPPDKIVLVVDAPRPDIYNPVAAASARQSYFGQMRRRLIDEAGKLKFRVLDLEAVFGERFARDHQTFEHPTDAHWNEPGHAVVAAKLRAILSDWPPLTQPPSKQAAGDNR